MGNAPDPFDPEELARLAKRMVEAHTGWIKPIPASDPSAQRCENCGLLAVFRIVERDWVPAEEAFRREGVRPARGSMLYAVGALCAANRRDFKGEAKSWDEWTQEDWLWKLREDQTKCDSFVRWVPGFSIKDHRAMLDRQWMIERDDAMRQIVWTREDLRDAAMRKREDERDALVNAREKARDDREDERDRQLEKRHRTELWVLGWVIAGATLAAAIIGATATCRSTSTVVVQQPVVAPTSVSQRGP